MQVNLFFYLVHLKLQKDNLLGSSQKLKNKIVMVKKNPTCHFLNEAIILFHNLINIFRNTEFCI